MITHARRTRAVLLISTATLAVGLTGGCASLAQGERAVETRRVTVYSDGGIDLRALARVDDDARLARTSGASTRPRYGLGVGDTLGVVLFSPLVEPTDPGIRTADVPIAAEDTD